MNDWRELALEYRKEVAELWNDIEYALDELEKGMPKSFKKGVHTLEKSLELSKENVRILSYTEPSGVSQKPQKQQSLKTSEAVELKIESKDYENCFKWLHNSE